MSGPAPDSSQPFNFFAGAIPSSPEPLAHVAGFYYVITSVMLWAPNDSDTEEVLIVDAESNRRLQATVGSSGGYAFPYFNLDCYMVMGNVAGALLYATGSSLFCSIDGFAFPPQDSPIW